MAANCAIPNCTYLATNGPYCTQHRRLSDKCGKEGCTNAPCSGELFCIQHRAAKVNQNHTVDDGFAFVDMTDIPANVRFNEKANKLFAAIKAAPEGKAMKVSLKVFSKSDLLSAQRYAQPMSGWASDSRALTSHSCGA